VPLAAGDRIAVFQQPGVPLAAGDRIAAFLEPGVYLYARKAGFFESNEFLVNISSFFNISV